MSVWGYGLFPLNLLFILIPLNFESTVLRLWTHFKNQKYDVLRREHFPRMRCSSSYKNKLCQKTCDLFLNVPGIRRVWHTTDMHWLVLLSRCAISTYFGKGRYFSTDSNISSTLLLLLPSCVLFLNYFLLWLLIQTTAVEHFIGIINICCEHTKRVSSSVQRRNWVSLGHIPGNALALCTFRCPKRSHIPLWMNTAVLYSESSVSSPHRLSSADGLAPEIKPSVPDF